MSNVTDWESIVVGYNDMFKTNYKNIGLLLINLYKETKSTPKMEKILGPAVTTIMKKLKGYNNIPIQKRGGDYLSRAPKKRAFLAIPDDKVRNMGIDEIMQTVDCSETFVHHLLKQKFPDYPNCYRRREGYPNCYREKNESLL